MKFSTITALARGYTKTDRSIFLLEIYQEMSIAPSLYLAALRDEIEELAIINNLCPNCGNDVEQTVEITKHIHDDPSTVEEFIYSRCPCGFVQRRD